MPDRNASLTFYLARYSINGTFLGFQLLKTQLSLCSMNYDDVLNMLKFGAVTENTCEYNLAQLVQWDEDKLPQEANTFFELFIKDRNGNLVDVPVLIRNFKNSQGLSINEGPYSESWRFTRRFFIYDTLSGIDQVNGYTNGTLPTIIRWASTIKMKITLDPTANERIYSPYLEITYMEK